MSLSSPTHDRSANALHLNSLLALLLGDLAMTVDEALIVYSELVKVGLLLFAAGHTLFGVSFGDQTNSTLTFDRNLSQLRTRGNSAKVKSIETGLFMSCPGQ